MPLEPPPSSWVFPPVHGADPDGPVVLGGDLEPGTLLAAYRQGLFPMPIGRRRLGWFSPDPRGVLLPGDVHVSHSLRRSMRSFEVRFNTAFAEVVAGCADPSRPHGWITPAISSAYQRLHQLGWAHSVEIWEAGELVGGLYGIGIGGFFAGESKFHTKTDASKAAVVALARVMGDHRGALIDVQWCTPHLATLGVIEMDREEYMLRGREAMSLPTPAAFDQYRAR